MSSPTRDPVLDLSLFQLRDPSALDFIAANPPLLDLLLEAREQIARWFPDALLFLDLDHDPDAPTHHRLFLSIGSALDPEDTCQALDQFDHQWWLKNLDRARGKLTITVEFI